MTSVNANEGKNVSYNFLIWSCHNFLLPIYFYMYYNNLSFFSLCRFYLAEITAGLHDLHNMGFVHRDVKPENVLIARSGHIKLADFGSVASLNTRGKVVRDNMMLDCIVSNCSPSLSPNK